MLCRVSWSCVRVLTLDFKTVHGTLLPWEAKVVQLTFRNSAKYWIILTGFTEMTWLVRWTLIVILNKKCSELKYMIYLKQIINDVLVWNMPVKFAMKFGLTICMSYQFSVLFLMGRTEIRLRIFGGIFINYVILVGIGYRVEVR